MSDTASTRATPTTRSTPDRLTATAPALLSSLVPLLGEWMPRQRWFAGKGRPIAGFELVSATELLPCGAGGATPGLLHLLVRARQPGSTAQQPGTADCYQLLLGVHSALPPQLAPAVVGRPSGGPLNGRTVYDALLDARLCALLLERLRVPGRLGALRFQREAGTTISSGMPARPVTAEQSNSSVVYGDSYILKVFRRTAPGLNPDLELPLALARVKCSRVPAPAAWFEAQACEGPPVIGGAGTGPGGVTGTGPDHATVIGPAAGADAPDREPTTLGVLQPFLQGSADGWQLALNALAVRADFTGPARALGHATAEVHIALAEALPTVELRRPQLDVIAAGMNERLEYTAQAVPALRPYCARLRTAFDELAALGHDGRSWTAQRVHGDLHLGQTLRSADEGRWSLIDFEGEPTRPLAERRRPQPAVRDVAGMLRSFDYAARSGPAGGDAWSLEWARRARAAFCLGYAEAGGLDPRSAPELMRAYETDKAVYEVLYEARHRPDWLPVPMAAVRRLAGAEPGRGADGDTVADRDALDGLA
ncbi:maltokinase [Streptomyces sp. MST-110588]|uniref:maltokinase N-terminal cap-like domain-containing protein n=1 Tax=Streptomyces sp. MST-110588 TaxID=2833628 RepID=UPI001F5C1A28|nr:maltokinase [Streptomyces sp. MST-110588]UNO39855.1 maltokinase [Streptomyces sp. MST-110588]